MAHHRHKKIRRKKNLKKARKVFGWTVLIGLTVGAFWWAANLGPASSDEMSAVERASGPSGELLEESREREQQFRAAVGEGAPGEDELDLLREAISLQRQYNRAERPTGEDRARLERMEEELSRFVAERIHADSRAAEARAEEYRSEGDLEAAAEAFAEAYDLQREINRRHGRTRFRNTGRESRLEQMQLILHVEPLYEQSRELEREGRQAIDAEEWDEAREALAKARDLQDEVNETARRTRFYDGGRVLRLEGLIDNIGIGEMASDLRSLREEADALAEEERTDEAAERYERAFSLQRRINREHPQSRYASSSAADELERDLHTARAAAGARQLADKVTALRTALAEGELSEIDGWIDEAKQAAEELFNRYPRSRYVDRNLLLELEYLSIVEPALGDLQRALTEDLLEVPGHEAWRMLRTEVPQRLYRTIMNANPSRNRGDDLPVDSVTLRQANRFCERASWILGRQVQLVTRDQFLAALGDWEPDAELAVDGDAPLEVHAGDANPHGFYHLVGNLGQWLAGSNTDNGQGWVAGGAVSGGSDSDALFRQVDGGSRSREIGFRYAVHDEPR